MHSFPLGLPHSYRRMEKEARPLDLRSNVEFTITLVPKDRRRLDQPREHDGYGIRVHVKPDSALLPAMTNDFSNFSQVGVDNPVERSL